MNSVITPKTIEEASERLSGVVKKTPLQFSRRLSKKFNAKIYLKREDLQEVRSYKIRGAYNLMSQLNLKDKTRGVICASAGNHAQGVALSASLLKIKATIFMPTITPLQKIEKVKHFGGSFVKVILIGKTFDESNKEAWQLSKKNKQFFVHPFDDYKVIEGQGTIGKEVYDKLGDTIDYILCPVGGGGLASGIGLYLKSKIKKIKVIGVEPNGAAGMHVSLKNRKIVSLSEIDTFVDGAAVARVGEKTFKIIARIMDDIKLIPEGKVCTTMIDLYQNDGIVAEPAGALSISALDSMTKEIKGKTVVCILSGGNNDILRYPEIMEKSLVFLGRKHYFLIEFSQKPGQLKQFVNKVLGPNEDITRFEYIKKTSKELGPALVGIELSKKEYFEPLIMRMKEFEIPYTLITESDVLYRYLI